MDFCSLRSFPGRCRSFGVGNQIRRLHRQHVHDLLIVVCTGRRRRNDDPRRRGVGRLTRDWWGWRTVAGWAISRSTAWTWARRSTGRSRARSPAARPRTPANHPANCPCHPWMPTHRVGKKAAGCSMPKPLPRPNAAKMPPRGAAGSKSHTHAAPARPKAGTGSDPGAAPTRPRTSIG